MPPPPPPPQRSIKCTYGKVVWNTSDFKKCRTSLQMHNRTCACGALDDVCGPSATRSLHPCPPQVEHGAVDVGLSPPDRRLFWVRLRLRSAQRTVLVATAHLTWPGHAQEVASAVNVRKAQARAMARALSQGLVRAQEPAFVAGDFNEGFWPRKLLNVAGFVDCFWELGARVPVTHPAYPCGDEDEDCLDAATLDWLTSNANAQASEAGVMEDMPRHGPGGLQASDHCPVWAQYTLIDEPRAFRAFRPTIEVALDDPPPCS